MKDGPDRERLPPLHSRMLTRPFQCLIAHQGGWLMRMRPAGRYLATNDTTDTAKEAHQ